MHLKTIINNVKDENNKLKTKNTNLEVYAIIFKSDRKIYKSAKK